MLDIVIRKYFENTIANQVLEKKHGLKNPKRTTIRDQSILPAQVTVA